MIYWMSERTDRILDEHNVEVIGFDPEKDAQNASCAVTLRGMAIRVSLGDVSGLDDESIDRRFAAAIFGLAHDLDAGGRSFVSDEEVSDMYRLADELLAQKESGDDA